MTRPPLPAVLGLEAWPESPKARRELVALLRGADRHALLAWAHAQLAAPVTREAWCARAGVTWQALRAARRASPALAALPVVVTGRVRVPDDALATDGARRARASRDRAKGVGPPKRKPGRAKRPA